MSTDTEIVVFGPTTNCLWKPERERVLAQAVLFDAKRAFFVVEPKEMHLKRVHQGKEGGKATVKTLCGQVSMATLCVLITSKH